jgi:hypothetical protein
MTPTPKHRWFAYSLRTLFVVVTAFGTWLGWNLHVVHQRQDLRKNLKGQQIQFSHSGKKTAPSVPAIRRLLGDEAVDTIVFPHHLMATAQEADVEEIRRMFPEAEILSEI